MSAKGPYSSTVEGQDLSEDINPQIDDEMVIDGPNPTQEEKIELLEERVRQLEERVRLLRELHTLQAEVIRNAKHEIAELRGGYEEVEIPVPPKVFRKIPMPLKKRWVPKESNEPEDTQTERSKTRKHLS